MNIISSTAFIELEDLRLFCGAYNYEDFDKTVISKLHNDLGSSLLNETQYLLACTLFNEMILLSTETWEKIRDGYTKSQTLSLDLINSSI